MQNVQLATCLEPLAEKIYATTRTKDSTPKTKLEHFISSGINFGWSFYDLSERIKDKGYKQPEYIFDISLRAQNEALRFRSGGKVVFGHCIFFPLIITSQLVNKTYEPEEILYGVKDVLKKTSKEDVNFFREVLKKNFSLSSKKQEVPSFEKYQNMFELTLDNMNNPKKTGLYHTFHEQLTGFPITLDIFNYLSKSEEKILKSSSKIWEKYINLEGTPPTNTFVGVLADLFVVAYYLLFTKFPEKEFF